MQPAPHPLPLVPRLAAERVLRAAPQLADAPLAVVADARGALMLASLTAAAEAAGLRRGMPLGDARAICPGLGDPARGSCAKPPSSPRCGAGPAASRPWVAEEGAEALVLDITGCAQLFGGEPGLVAGSAAEAADFGLTPAARPRRYPGAAWALARYAGAGSLPAHAGDAIDQEAPATRSRAQKRRWERGGAPPPVLGTAGGPGSDRAAGRDPAPYRPVAGGGAPARSRRGGGACSRSGSAASPRWRSAAGASCPAGRAGGAYAGSTRRSAASPEPVSPARPPHVFAFRLTFPEPIGLEADVLAGIDKLLPPLCARLSAAGQGARRVRLTLVRTDGKTALREIGLARPADRPRRSGRCWR